MSSVTRTVVRPRNRTTKPSSRGTSLAGETGGQIFKRGGTEVPTEKLMENIYYRAEWRGSNPSFITTSEGIVLIDLPPDIEKARIWAAEISKRGKTRYIINTEAHHDHWVTNSLFGDQIISHEITRDLMSIMNHKFIRERTNTIYAEPFEFPDSFELRLPNITFSKNMTLRLGKHTFQLLHTPGHTEGQIAVYMPDQKVLFTGDTIISGIRTPFHDAITDERWLESLKMLYSLDIAYIVPGHGAILNGKEYLKTTMGVVEGFLTAVKEGKTRGTSVPPEVHKTFDPYYNVRNRGLTGPMLAPSKQSKMTGKHST
jgi:cyclase